MAESSKDTRTETKGVSFEAFKNEVLNDYRIVCESREASLLGRREVLTGKAKFGIFGDGKEVAQVAMAKNFKPGDFRSGYYRDQTFMAAAGLMTWQQFFAQLYAHPNLNADPFSAGRMMNAHFATRTVADDGTWNDISASKNSSADISPTAGQMPRLLGLAYASKMYRHNPELKDPYFGKFSIKGNEVAFGTIGDASTSEGCFFETINAAGVLQVPMAVSVWDDGFGISVPVNYQTTKQSISEALAGFAQTDEKHGYLIYTVNGWDYAALCSTYEEGIRHCRSNHIPVLFHVREMTQPQGHSTSGSHERYKSKERLQFEQDFDCIVKLKEYILLNALADEEELTAIEKQAGSVVRKAKAAAWKEFTDLIHVHMSEARSVLEDLATSSSNSAFILKIIEELVNKTDPFLGDIITAVKKSLRLVSREENLDKSTAVLWLQNFQFFTLEAFSSHLYNESASSALIIKAVEPVYTADSPEVDGREVLLNNFDMQFSRIPQLLAFGEDLGQIGGVNQTYAGLQAKYGSHRIFDTGIRETTIIGQGVGMALRGLRPIAEIQYLDYLLYALQTLSDDLSTLQYRTKGSQRAPLIVSTRGHRLEGIWHSGSPMSMILGSLRGMHILVPRNMTQAAGFYNTLLAAEDPALVIEPLNGYRIKERLPSNLGDFRVALGVPEILRLGNDITIVTYGSCCRVVMEAAEQLAQHGIDCEVVDVQSLMPFDVHGMISQSLKKTNRVLFVDEDVPGGGTAFMMQQVIEIQKGFYQLDAAPVTLSAKAHRPAYGSDGDYFSKPNVEDVFDQVYRILSDSDPQSYPDLY